MGKYRETKIAEAKSVMISPTLAFEMLKHNKVNRKINERRVLIYAHEMQHGEWKETGHPIVVSSEGNLIDGQHRLHAILKSNCTIPTMVVTIEEIDGLGPLTAIDVPIDIGYTRNTSNITGINPRYVTVIKTLMRMLEKNGDVKALSPAIITERYESMKPYLMNIPNKRSKIYSSASIVGALVVSDYTGFNAWGVYLNVINKHYDKINPFVASWMRKVEKAYNLPTSERNKIMLASTYKMVGGLISHSKVLILKDPEDEINECKASYNDLISNKPPFHQKHGMTKIILQ